VALIRLLVIWRCGEGKPLHRREEVGEVGQQDIEGEKNKGIRSLIYTTTVTGTPQYADRL